MFTYREPFTALILTIRYMAEKDSHRDGMSSETHGRSQARALRSILVTLGYTGIDDRLMMLNGDVVQQVAFLFPTRLRLLASYRNRIIRPGTR